MGGLNSELVKNLRLEGVGQLNEIIIIGGRKTNINSENVSKEELVSYLNDNIHTTKDLMNKIRTAEDPEEVIYDNIEKESEAATYTILDMNDGAPIVLPLSINNIENISRSFESWRDAKLQRILDPDVRNNFDFATNHLVSQKSDNLLNLLAI